MAHSATLHAGNRFAAIDIPMPDPANYDSLLDSPACRRLPHGKAEIGIVHGCFAVRVQIKPINISKRPIQFFLQLVSCVVDRNRNLLFLSRLPNLASGIYGDNDSMP